MIVSAAPSRRLAERVAKIAGDRVVDPQRKVFPDGEAYVRIPEEDESITVIGSTHQPDRNWVELLLLVDAALRLTDDVKVIIPYYGYGRQDRVFLKGEPVSAEVFAKALSVNSFATVEPHFIRNYGKFEMFGKTVYSLSAYGVVGEFLKGMKVDVVVAPDEGAVRFANQVAREVDAHLMVLHKERDHHTGKIKMSGERVVGDRVAVVDDIIGSGGTMLLASRFIDANKIYFVGVHGVFSPGWERLKETGEVIVTDTIEREESRISVARVLAEWLKVMTP